MDSIRLRGRWKDQRALEHYAQECGAALADMRLTRDVRNRSAWLGARSQTVVLEAAASLQEEAARGEAPVLHDTGPRHLPFCRRRAEQRARRQLLAQDLVEQINEHLRHVGSRESGRNQL